MFCLEPGSLGDINIWNLPKHFKLSTFSWASVRGWRTGSQTASKAAFCWSLGCWSLVSGQLRSNVLCSCFLLELYGSDRNFLLETLFLMERTKTTIFWSSWLHFRYAFFLSLPPKHKTHKKSLLLVFMFTRTTRNFCRRRKLFYFSAGDFSMTTTKNDPAC